MNEARRRRLGKRLKLAGLALAGMCTVSIPATIALVLSATGASDVITIGTPQRDHVTPAHAIAQLRCVPTSGYYALTFDDGPDPTTTPRLVAALSRSRAVATFFDVGQRAEDRPDLVEQQRGVGQVASHGYSHLRLTEVSSERRIEELQAAARALDYPNAFVRPPDGVTDPAVDADIRRSGLTPVYWTVDVDDAQPADPDAIVQRALAVEPGGIIRLHEGVEATIEAIPALVTRLSKRGMCPGFLERSRTTLTAADGVPFQVRAVRP
jgi:peptidoglycan/xylan/chitin deacetylase (PgdA/CDA1 family)